VRGYLRSRDRRKVENRTGPRKTWQLVVDNGFEVKDGVKTRRQEVRSFFGTRREADDALRAFIEEIKKGVLVRDRKRTLEAFLTEWLARKRLELAPKSYGVYEQRTRTHIIPALGEIPLAGLRKEHVRAALDIWNKATIAKRPITARTVHAIFSTLRTALHDAQDAGLITALPFSKRMAPKKIKKEIATPDETEVLALLNYLDATSLGAPTRIAVLTGLRQGELLGLTWEAIDFERRVLHVRQSIESSRNAAGERVVRFKEPKTAKSRRVVPLTTRAVEVLRGIRADQARQALLLGGPLGDGRLVFPHPTTGDMWKPDSFAKDFARHVRLSGLPKVTFHSMRHAYASISLRAGTPLKVVSDLLGHTTLATTADLYTHVVDDLRTEAADRLEAVFEKAETRRIAAIGEQGSWAKCGPIVDMTKKKARGYRLGLVAPTRIELVSSP
jgi:integrase